MYKIQNGKAELIETDIRADGEKSYWGMGHGAVLYNFYNYLETGNGEYITLESTENTMKALFAFYESAQKNERIIIK